MTGFLIVTHYQLAQEFLRAVELIAGELDHFRAIGLDPQVQPDEMRTRIEKALHEVDTGDGVVILDPSCLREEEVPVLSARLAELLGAG